MKVLLFIHRKLGIVINVLFRVSTPTGKIGKPGEFREVFPVREKPENFQILSESQGKVRIFWSSQGKLDQKIFKNI